MKPIIFNLLFCIIFLTGTVSVLRAQGPVRWQFSSKKIADKTYELHFTAYIEQPWHIYAHDMNEDLGLPTTFEFSKNPMVDITGKIQETGELIEEDAAGVKIKFYEKKVDFIQVVKVKAAIKTTVSGKIDYMACTRQMCLPPAKQNFNFSLQ